MFTEMSHFYEQTLKLLPFDAIVNEMNKFYFRGRVGRVVALDTKGPQFEYILDRFGWATP